ncbi:MAG: response regulator [Polyangiaceae bacterium]
MTSGALILVVEDDPDIRESIQEILEDEGYRVATAFDGEDALRCLRESARPDLILLDLLMPRMNAREFRDVQLLDAAWSRIPTVIMSADFHYDEKARELGAAAGVAKPVALDDLLAVVRACLGAGPIRA